MVRPLGVDLNAYYGIHDQIVVLTMQARALFIHVRTGTLYFYKKDVEGFENAYREADLSFGRRKHHSWRPRRRHLRCWQR